MDVPVKEWFASCELTLIKLRTVEVQKLASRAVRIDQNKPSAYRVARVQILRLFQQSAKISPREKSPQTFFPEKFTPAINILSLYTDVALLFFSIICERVGETSVFAGQRAPSFKFPLFLFFITPPPSTPLRHPPERRLPNEKAGAYLLFFLASVNCIFWSHLGPVQTPCFCRAELNSGIKFDKSTEEARRLNQTFELIFLYVSCPPAPPREQAAHPLQF